MLFSFLFFISQISNYDILEQAEKSGFYYKQVNIIETEKCNKNNFCITSNGKKYLLKNKSDVKITLKKREKNSLKLSISPSNKYVAYYLFIQRKNSVEKRKIKFRNIVLKGAKKIFAVQIVGEGVNGPQTIFLRHFFLNLVSFKQNLIYSINILRKKSGLKPLKKNKKLEKFAKQSISRIKTSGLVHYSSKTGSLAQSGIHSLAFGENLYSAKNLEEAFLMLQKSPSHLYNLLYPNYNNIFEKHFNKNGLITGIIIFSY